VFIGRRGVTRTPARGRFQCPHCGLSRPYAHKRLRRFFVFLFVPVVPLDGEVEFVQCGFCRRAFSPSILGPTAGHEPEDPELEARVRAHIEEIRAGAAATTLLVWEDEAG